MKALLESGAEVNHANKNGSTALYVAAQSGHVRATRALLEAGAEVNRAYNKGRTPLYGDRV